jgi:hypothetical protein
MARKRRQNPEAARLQFDIDSTIITSGAVMDLTYVQYAEAEKGLKTIARIEIAADSQGKSLPPEVRAKKRELKAQIRGLDSRIAAYTKLVIKQSKSRIKAIKDSPMARLHKYEIREVEKDIFKLEGMMKRHGADVRLMSNRLIGGLVTLEKSMAISPSKPKATSSRQDRETASIQRIAAAVGGRWNGVRKHARKHERFFIRGSEVFSKRYGTGVVVDNDGRKITVSFEDGPSKKLTKVDLVPAPILWVDAQLHSLKEKFKKGRSVAKSDIQRIVAKIESIHSQTKPRAKLRTYSEAKRSLGSLIGKIQTRLAGDKMDKSAVEALLLDLEEVQTRVPARSQSEWNKVDQRQWATDVSKVRKSLVKLRRKSNPCIGFHFHGKDADELLKAVEKSNSRQRAAVKSNPGKKKATKKKSAKKKVARKSKPEWQRLIDRCRKLWDHYCERPSKKRLKPVIDHLEKMKASTSKKVVDERKSCLRIANKEARRLKMK